MIGSICSILPSKIHRDRARLSMVADASLCLMTLPSCLPADCRVCIIRLRSSEERPGGTAHYRRSYDFPGCSEPVVQLDLPLPVRLPPRGLHTSQHARSAAGDPIRTGTVLSDTVSYASMLSPDLSRLLSTATTLATLNKIMRVGIGQVAPLLHPATAAAISGVIPPPIAASI